MLLPRKNHVWSVFTDFRTLTQLSRNYLFFGGEGGGGYTHHWPPYWRGHGNRSQWYMYSLVKANAVVCPSKYYLSLYMASKYIIDSKLIDDRYHCLIWSDISYHRWLFVIFVSCPVYNSLVQFQITKIFQNSTGTGAVASKCFVIRWDTHITERWS